MLRATVGVIAGTMDFRYDDIIQLRVAMSEVFELANRHAAAQRWNTEAHQLDVRFEMQPDRLEIEITSYTELAGSLSGQDQQESRALLESLMDSVEVAVEDRMVRMVKYKPSREQT